MFSSREVMQTRKGTTLFLRVPVPDGFSVVSDGVVNASIKHLPPVEVLLIQKDAAPPVARVCCEWLTFKQKKRVGAIINRLWNPSAPLDTNITKVLQEAPGCILHSCGIDILDLSWQEAFNGIRTRSGSAYEQGEPQHDAQKPRKLNEKIRIETISYYRKGRKVFPSILEYNQTENEIGSITGTSKVTCLLSTHCDSEILPTQAFRLKGCDGHYMCNTCAINFIMSESTKIQPKCVAYGCSSKFDSELLIRLTRFDPAAMKKVDDMILEEEMFLYAKEFSTFMCPNASCKKAVRPRKFVDYYKLTLCPHCNQCWCETCSRGDEECKVQLGVGLHAGGNDAVEKMVDDRGPDFTQKVIDAFNPQFSILHDMQACPRCASGVEKSGGCNKMVCNCGQYFCYQCGEALDLVNPYAHFQSGNCTVYEEGYDEVDEVDEEL